MAPVNKDEILHDHNHDGIDRRGFLRCMAWAAPVRSASIHTKMTAHFVVQ